MILIWMWPQRSARRLDAVDIGGGIRLPTYVSGTTLAFVVGDGDPAAGLRALYLSFFFSYLYLWTVSPQAWPQTDGSLPRPEWAIGSGALLVLSAVAMAVAGRVLPERNTIRIAFVVSISISTVALFGACGAGNDRTLAERTSSERA